MREIKFRVWDVKDKYMAYPNDCVGIDPKAKTDLMYCDMETVAVGLQGQLYLLDECGRWDYPSNPELDKEIILMQWTGLTDKNGVEIYEGDILRLWRSEGQQGQLRGKYCKPLTVEYDPLWCQFVVSDDDVKEQFGIWQQFGAFEVIGNIHEGVKE